MSVRKATNSIHEIGEAAESFTGLKALPAGWMWAKLGDVCNTTSGGTPSRKNAEYFTGDIPWVKSGELPDGFVTEVEERITEDAVANSSAKLFPAGTLLIALYGATVGKLGILKEDATTNQAVCAIFPPEDLDTRYLFWYLRLVRSDLVAQAVGGAQPNISQGILRDLLVPIAPLDQQKRIVAEIEKQFSRLDEAVANLKRVKANLKRYKAAVLKAAVEGRLVEIEAKLARREGRSFETGEQLLQRILKERRQKWEETELAKMKGKGNAPRNENWKRRYKEPTAPNIIDLSELPEGWVWASIEQLASLVDYGSSAKASEDSSGIPVLRMGNVVEGELVFHEVKYLPTKHDEFPRLLLQPGDLLFNRTNSSELVGKTAVFDGSPQKCSFASYLIRVRLVDGSNPKYLSAYISSSHGRNWVKSVVTQQVGQANVNGTKLQALAVPLPPEAEQRRIVSEMDRRLSLIGGATSQTDINLQRSERMRQSILARAFGERIIRVGDCAVSAETA